MEKSAVLQTLLSSEKNRSLVTIKTIHAEKPLRGFVEKVLNQMIIVRSVSTSPLTLTFTEIESVMTSNLSHIERVLRIIRKTLHKHTRL